MTDPSTESEAIEPGAPFQPDGVGGDPADVDKRALYGCGVGCLTLALLCGLLLLVLMARPGRVLRWMLLVSEQALVENAPEDWGEAERRRLQDAFSSARQAVKRKTVDAVEFEATLSMIVECLRKAQRQEVRREHLQDLTTALEGLGETGPVAELWAPGGPALWGVPPIEEI